MKFSFIFFFIYLNAVAQLPTNCNLFYTDTNPFTSYNPYTLSITTNTITKTISAGGLAINRNLNASFPTTTFYTADGGFYYYYDGSSWVNTGHTCSNISATNLGGANIYLYNLAGSTGKVYRYDGTGNDVLVLTLPTFNGPYDVIGDDQGNFYLLNTTVMALQKYSSTGVLLCSYNLVGLPSIGGRGFAVIGNKLFVTLVSGTYEGIINGTTINFSPSTFVTTTPFPGDYASCPIKPLSLNLSLSNSLSCNANTALLTATSTASSPTYSWSGTGIISDSTLNSITVNSGGIYTVIVSSGLPCNEISSNTISVISSGVSPIANAGSNQLLKCDDLFVSLSGFASGGTGAITYSWNPSASLNNPLIINPNANPINTTTYVLTAIDSNNCQATSSVVVSVENNSDLIIPNVFTPNGDGINDIFLLKFNCVKEVTLIVLNRWGQKIHEQISSSDIKWDGRVNNIDKAIAGTYFYVIKAIDYKDLLIEKNGFISLIK